MIGQSKKCELCKKEAHLPGEPLCQTCFEAIARLMDIATWKSNREEDKRRNREQADVLRRYARGY